MHSRRNGGCVSISVGACLLCALLFLILPLQWIFAAAVSALIHECCHALAVQMCGGRLSAFYIGSRGADMRAESLPPAKELICYFAGPLSGLLILPLFHLFPRIVFCSVVHSAYNLLPFFHLDGGKALHTLLRMFRPEAADKICRSVQICTLAVLWILALHLMLRWKIGLVPVLFVLSIAISAKKDLANNDRKGYNSTDINKGVRL